jgi:uncharacterized protein YndB with AHSA1/START domain
VIRAQVVIDRSPQIVWAYFTEVEHWHEWQGYGLESADWKPGGELRSELGGSSSIIELTPEKSVRYQLTGSFTQDSLFTFESLEDGRATRVTAQLDYAGVSFSDGGASRRAGLEAALGRLKDLVESDSSKG